MFADSQSCFIESYVERITKTEKGISREPFTALDTLEQEPRLECR